MQTQTPLHPYSLNPLTDNCSTRHTVLKILRPYRHLRPLVREVGIFPMVPIHSLIAGLAVKVQAIQVGMVATVIPPGTFITHSTID